MRVGFVGMVVVLACVVGLAWCGEKDGWVELIGEGMKGWRKPTADWMNVGEAVKDPQNEKKIATKPGQGILVNGPKGRTRNLRPEGQDAQPLLSARARRCRGPHRVHGPKGLELGGLLHGPLRGPGAR